MYNTFLPFFYVQYSPKCDENSVFLNFFSENASFWLCYAEKTRMQLMIKKRRDLQGGGCN